MTYQIKYRKEEEMSDSGIEWLGMVPKEWEITRVKRIFDIKSGHGFPNELQGNTFGDIPFLKVSDINKSNKYVNKSINYVTKKEVKKYRWFIIEENSILMAKIGEALRKNHRKINTTKCIIDNNMLSLSVKDRNLVEYWYYIMKIIDMDWYTNPGAVPSVNMEEFRNSYIPKANNQQKIANFLDIKTSEIDSIISKKERLIRKLEESKKSLISEVVTGKVKIVDGEIVERKSEEMKDSGVERLGMIPKDWEVGKLRWYLNCKSGDFIKNVEVRKEGSNIYKFPVIGGNGIMGYSKKYNTIKDVIAIGRVGALCGNVHLVNYKSWITDNSLIISHNEKKFEIKYLETLLRNINLNKYSTSTAQPLITGETIKKRRVVIPKLDEQQKNILYLETKSRRINSIIKKTNLQIQKLKEAKQSLISEAVTGKIDLSDWEII